MRQNWHIVSGVQYLISIWYILQNDLCSMCKSDTCHPQSYEFVSSWWGLRPLSNFEICNTALLTTVSILSVTSPDLLYVDPLRPFHPQPPLPPSATNLFSASRHWVCSLSRCAFTHCTVITIQEDRLQHLSITYAPTSRSITRATDTGVA